MKPIVKNGVAILQPQGFLDGNNTPSFLTMEDMHFIETLKVDIFVVSLKKVIFFNKNGLDTFIKLFTSLRKLNQNRVFGFCDVDLQKFNAIKKFYEDDLSFSIFQSSEIAYLFASNYKNESKTVLVYSEDKSQRSAIAIELFNNGHNPIIAQSKEEFEEKRLKSGTYDIIVNLIYLGQFGQKIATRVTGNAIVYTVSGFLDNETSSVFNIEYHNNSLNIGFRLFVFDASEVISMNIHALNFLSKLSSAAAEYNATIVIVGMSFEKTPLSFKDTLQDAGLMFFEQIDDILKNKELLDELGAGSSANIKNKRVLNKQHIVELPKFIDASIGTIEMMTNAKATKKSAELTLLKVGDKKDKLASSIGYYGDMDGMVVLVFPREIAKKASKLLIGEESDEIEVLLDILAELVNIAGGKIKTLLSNENISVSITLPRTYKDVDDLMLVIGDRKGALVELEFNNDTFLFFLTR